MKITKYEHACLVLEEGDKKLVIDPGIFTKSLPINLTNVVGVVITHVHPDHCDPNLIQNIVTHNPEAKFYGTGEVSVELKSVAQVQVVTGGESASIGPFNLKFFGGQHAVIHPSWPTNQNVGVEVNEKLYYPGDSFTNPEVPVKLLALPVSAPWLKTSESMDFFAAVKPEIAFPTHNALLSDNGENLIENIHDRVAQNLSCEFRHVKPGDILEI